jgi:hypothetical protein
MKKVAMFVILLMMTGCVGAKGWSRQDGQPMDQERFNVDRWECNRGWETPMVVDILFTGGVLSWLHYREAKKCMLLRGYYQVPEVKEARATPREIVGPPLAPAITMTDPHSPSEVGHERPNPIYWQNRPPWER